MKLSLSAFIILLSVACTHTTRVEIAHAVVSCAKQDGTVLQAIEREYEKIEEAVKTGGWSTAVSVAIVDGLVVGGCALARIVSNQQKSLSVADGAVARTSTEMYDAFEAYRAKYAGGATFDLSK